MDRERFNTLLADMDKITDQDIKSLNQLRKQYPYFQNQYVMIARALKKRNHPKTDAFIKKAAIYSADRALLKAIIMDEHDFASIVEEPAGPPPAAEKTVVVVTEEAATPVKEVKKEAPATPEKKAEVTPPEQEEEPVIASKTETGSEEKPAEKAEVPAIKSVPEKTEAVAVSEPKAEENAPLSAESKKATPSPAQEELKEVLVGAEAPQPTAKPQDNQQLIDDLERDLIEIRKKKQLIAKMLEQQEAKHSQKKAAPVKKKTPAPKTSQSELIEKFIQNEPQMGKQKLVHDETEQQRKDLAARFTQEQEDFYTETMAKLMVTQKKYRKAIQVYEKLGLKFPEKRAYFASQIEQVKSRSNV